MTKSICVSLMSLTLLFNSGCFAGGNSLSSKTRGPEFTASLSKRDSGATSRGSTFVSIVADGVPDDSTHGVIVFSVSRNQDVQERWLDAHHLEVTCSLCKWEDITLETLLVSKVVIVYGANLSMH